MAHQIGYRHSALMVTGYSRGVREMVSMLHFGSGCVVSPIGRSAREGGR
jgi:hypothetical protein